MVHKGGEYILVYLDNAATSSPKPEEVCIAVEKCIRGNWGNPGRSASKVSNSDDIVYETRELISNFVNISDPKQVIFTSSATDSLNLAISGILKKGDHVITTSIEHNSVIRPLKHLELENKIELSIVNANTYGYVNPNDIKSQIKSNTKLIVTTHASNVIGTIVPIQEIGKIASQNKIAYLVDCSQTIGVLDIDVQKMNIDMLAFPGHKSLFGPTGIGALYIRPGIDLVPLRYGGTGKLSEGLTQPNEMPYKYESGTSNTIGIAGLNAGIKFILKEGIKNIREYEEHLAKYMINRLKENALIEIYGADDVFDRTAVISVNVKNQNPSEIGYDLLNAFDIITRTGLQCSPLSHKTIGTEKRGTIRFSIGYFNTEKDIDYTIDAIKQICKTL
jgi:cysteine desulfurase/selenocysteine lyase